MKWTHGGPIVAKSRISSTLSGHFTEATIETLRELSRGTRLYDLARYWESVRRKGRGYFTVIRLVDEEWLDPPLVTNARSYGSSWIALDTPQKRKEWLETAEPEESDGGEEGRFSVSVRSSARRRSLSPRLRFAVLRRDNFTCRYCGRKAPFVKLEVDHVVPYTTVRDHTVENLAASCVDCNRGKGARHL